MNCKYLDPKLKERYMIDFKKLLSITKPTWKLDPGLRDIFIKINSNEHIHTLYSKKHDINDLYKDDSYLKFCYSKEVEKNLFRSLLPELILNYNSLSDTILYYEFYYPKKNPNYRESDNEIGLGCTDDKDYFCINHLGVYLKSSNMDTHNEFWEDLERNLCNLKP